MDSIITNVYSMRPGSGNRVCNFVRQQVPPGIIEQPHTHAFLKVMRIISGRAEWMVNNVCHILEPGMFVILNDSELRYIRMISSAEPLIMDWFQFQPLTIFSQMPADACMRLCSIFYLRPPGFSNIISHGSSRNPEISAVYASLVQNAAHPDLLQDEAVISSLCALLVEITRHYISELGSGFLENEVVSVGNFQKLTEAITFIRSHYMENITEQQVARHVFMSPPYFSKLFQVYYGIRFRSYLRQLRMEKTLELLRSPVGSTMTVLHAALSCGFTSASGFYKCMRDMYGRTGTREIVRNMGISSP